MKTITNFAAALSLSIAAAGHAAADSHHGHAGGPLANDSGPSAGKGEMMQDMMRMMMPMMMHGQMMGTGPGGVMSMMDGDMMRMMMGPGMVGDGPAAEPEPEAARTAMLSRLAEFDADGDGSLSLTEFETLHAAMIRETMVDRFQHLDADGDGSITETEMGAPAQRMEMRRGMPGASDMMDGRMPSGN